MPTYKRGCWVLARTIPSPAVSKYPTSLLPFGHFTRFRGWLTAGIAHNPNRKPGGEPAEPNAEAGSELQEPLVNGHHLFEVARDDDAGNETVNGQDLRHDGAEAVYSVTNQAFRSFVEEQVFALFHPMLDLALLDPAAQRRDAHAVLAGVIS